MITYGSAVIVANFAQGLTIEEMTPILHGRSDEWLQAFWRQISINEAKRIAAKETKP